MQQRLLVGLVGLGFWVSASPAEACTTLAPPPALHGYPEDGASEVPTDVVPIYNVYDARIYFDDLGELAGTLSLRTAEGQEVAVTVQPSHNWWLEISPAAALQPHTRYVLEARPSPNRDEYTSEEGPLSLAFTTGAGPVSELPSAPVARVQEWQFRKDVSLSTCDWYNEGTCIAVPSGQFVEARYSNNEGFSPSPVHVYLYNEASAINFHGGSRDEPFVCVQLRNRALNGQYGEPTTYCDEDAAKFEITHSASLGCTAQGLVHEGELVTTSRTAKLLSTGTPLPGESTTDVVASSTSGGCTLGAQAPQPPALLWGAVAAAVSLLRRRLSRLAQNQG